MGAANGLLHFDISTAFLAALLTELWDWLRKRVRGRSKCVDCAGEAACWWEPSVTQERFSSRKEANLQFSDSGPLWRVVVWRFVAPRYPCRTTNLRECEK